jgi:serine protease Do|tara:strand:- start:51 stop:1643 length:1593 start_codon:yes stop_codon:yes gene_type:complete
MTSLKPIAAPQGRDGSRQTAQNQLSSNQGRWIKGTALTLLAGALLAGTILAGNSSRVVAQTTPAATAGITAPASFAQLNQQVSPAVVNISIKRSVPASAQHAPQGSTPFRDFFEQFQDRFGQIPGGRAPGEQAPQQTLQALGSGFIIDPKGFVVTNNHVVEGADEIEVKLPDGRSFQAKLIGGDKRSDLALLKIDSNEALPFVTLGDSDSLLVGDWVVAIGNPFGLGGSLTSGIVSARGRDINSGPYDDYIQTDAAINRGNSGGPMFNLKGEVVGVNTAIYSPSGGSVGIGFAIPANVVKSIITDLKDDGRVDRGWLGVQIQPVSGEIAEALGLSKTEGALVVDVTPDSPAAAAGLKQGDVIIQFGGSRVDKMRSLPRLVAAINPGKTADVTVWRNGAEKSFRVEIGLLKPQQVAAQEHSMQPKLTDGTLRSEDLGATLTQLNDQAKQQLGLPESAQGVLIKEVENQGVAAKQGLRPGDVIRQVDGEDVSQPTQISDLISAKKKDNKKALLLLVTRDGRDLFIGLPLSAA